MKGDLAGARVHVIACVARHNFIPSRSLNATAAPLQVTRNGGRSFCRRRTLIGQRDAPSRTRRFFGKSLIAWLDSQTHSLFNRSLTRDATSVREHAPVTNAARWDVILWQSKIVFVFWLQSKEGNNLRETVQPRLNKYIGLMFVSLSLSKTFFDIVVLFSFCSFSLTNLQLHHDTLIFSTR